jgi:hypothetical protein
MDFYRTGQYVVDYTDYLAGKRGKRWLRKLARSRLLLQQLGNQEVLYTEQLFLGVRIVGQKDCARNVQEIEVYDEG